MSSSKINDLLETWRVYSAMVVAINKQVIQMFRSRRSDSDVTDIKPKKEVIRMRFIHMLVTITSERTLRYTPSCAKHLERSTSPSTAVKVTNVQMKTEQNSTQINVTLNATSYINILIDNTPDSGNYHTISQLTLLSSLVQCLIPFLIVCVCLGAAETKTQMLYF